MTRYLKMAVQWLKRAFTKNMGMKIGAILFAFLMWSFVQAEENPVRQKVFNDVTVTYNSAERVRERGYTSAQPLSELLKSASVTVETNANRLNYITYETISAYVDLSVVNEPGEYTLPVRGLSTNGGSVVQVSPSEIKVQFEQIVSQAVPVEVVVDESGKKESLYYGDPVSGNGTVEITGARSNVEAVAKAVCEIDVSNITSTSIESRTVTLLDENGEVLPADMFTNVPSVIVEMPVYNKKSVAIDADVINETITGVPNGYEIAEISVLPGTIEVIGTEEGIEKISAVKLAPIVLTEEAEIQIQDVRVIVPEGAYKVQPEYVQVSVGISPKEEETTYAAVDISYKNLLEEYTVKLSPASIDVNVRGTKATLDEFTAQQLKPFVDLSGLEAGEYKLEVKFENEPDLEVSITPSAAFVYVTVSDKEQPETSIQTVQ